MSRRTAVIAAAVLTVGITACATGAADTTVEPGTPTTMTREAKAEFPTSPTRHDPSNAETT